MGIRFEHVQSVADMRLMMGDATSEIDRAAPITEDEFYRALVDPGFAGTLSSIEADLYFERYSSVSQSVGWKWQIRSLGQSTWTDLATATETWAGYAQTRRRVFFDSSALGANDDAPFEMRFLATASTSATVKIKIGTCTPALRIIGESL